MSDLDDKFYDEIMRDLLTSNHHVSMFLSALAATLSVMEQKLGGTFNETFRESLLEMCNRLESETLLNPMSMKDRRYFRALHVAFLDLYQKRREMEGSD